MAKKASLKEYEQKRDLKKSPEPGGKKKPAKASGNSSRKKSPIFVVQKHDATTLHYDFRLEYDGVLASWAVPKGPSTNPEDRRLAIMVEDHPLDYAQFEGVIPSGYGAGTVIVWDTGTYRNIMGEKPKPLSMRESIEAGHVEVFLEGEKLTGAYVLVRTKMGGRENNWLLKKMKDEYADAAKDILKTKPESAQSGKTIEQVREEE